MEKSATTDTPRGDAGPKRRDVPFEEGAALPGSDLVAELSLEVERHLSDLLSVEDTERPLDRVATHLIEAGGKRFRPTVLLLAAKAVDHDESQAVYLASAGELIHSASLLHDDVVDRASRRRGKESGRLVWGNTYAVLAGDLCLVLALTQVERAGSLKAVRALSSAVRAMVDAEVAQLDNRDESRLSAELYLRIISGKTAALMSWCSSIGGLGPDWALDALSAYGRHLGLAFQIVDDVLDYEASPDALGKPVGQDLREGNLTLPLIEASRLRAEIGSDLRRLRHATSDTERSDLIGRIIESVRTSGALDTAREAARAEATRAERALDGLEESPFKEALVEMPRFVAERRS